MKVDVVGTGHTPFGKTTEDIAGLMGLACNGALDDSNATITDVDAIYVSNFSSSFSNQCHLPAVLASKLGVNKEITRVESACAGGGLALKEGILAILSGLYDTVLVCGAEKMSGTPIADATRIIARAADQQEILHGATFPSLYALIARRHFYEFGTNEEQMARIAVKNHHNAMNNPLAQFKKEITLDGVLASRVVASPLKVLDCAPVSDGAAAILLTSRHISGRFTDSPVHVAGIGHDVDFIGLCQRPTITAMPAVIRAAKKAYTMSKMTSSDIDIAEIHDCFTIAELVETEDLGFCRKGEGGRLVEEGETEIGGRIPVNTSGGLKAKGHPIGATGVSQVVEIVKQLQGNAGVRTISGVERGLCCNVGGSGSSAIVSIFTR